MEDLNIIQQTWENNPGVFLLVAFLIFIAVVGNWRLYVKCDQPGIAAFIPIYNVIIALKIIGRPTSHIFLFLIPIFNIYFAGKMLVELVQCFGKFSIIDYIFALVFNVFYVLNLGLAYNEVYYGPVYGMSLREIKSREAQFA